MQIKAALLYEPNTPLSIEEVTLDEPRQNEALVRMVATGLCHTDLHVMKGDIPNALPVVLGHEGAGVVEKIGPGVTTLQPGDHVLLLALYTCGTCRYCAAGQPALCPESLTHQIMGDMPSGGKRLRKGDQELNHFYSQGSFAEYAVIHERQAVKIRNEAPLEIACILGCGVTTGLGAIINRSGMRPGDNVVVYGCGGVGLGSVMAAKLAGAGKLIAVDTLDSKLEKARELGADHVINASRENPQEKILEITGIGADISVESIGKIPVMTQAFSSIHNGGTCVIVGIAPVTDMLSIAPFELLLGKKLIGSVFGNVRPSIDIPMYIDLYMAGKLPIDKLITRYYTLDEVNEGYEAMEKGEIIRSAIRF